MVCFDSVEANVGYTFENLIEAVKVVEILIGFLIAGEVDPYGIPVMSAYAAQVRLVKKPFIYGTTYFGERM